jgi:divalent metal cation (Fe/Co/Zn/Cd) transporter
MKSRAANGSMLRLAVERFNVPVRFSLEVGYGPESREAWSALFAMTETRHSESSSLDPNAAPRAEQVAAPSRLSLISAALRISYFTIAWNGVVGAAGLVVAVFTGSLALAGFAGNALLDSSASAVLVWRFLSERRNPLAAERVERRAQAVVAAAMIAVGLSVLVEAARALAGRAHAHESALGFAVATVSVLVLPVLGRRKLRVAAALPSAALRGDGVLTIAAAALAVITLLTLFATSALGWWWADPAAALLIAVGLTAEGLRVAIRHRFG